MHKLVVNPGTPQAWEIQLKEGANLLGRGAANDFKLDDPSVSGSHCQILVENGNATIKDLGSTNGTMVNRAPVTEAVLEPGQTVHLGGVELMFQSDAVAPATVIETKPPPPRITIIPREVRPAPVTVASTVVSAPPQIPPLAPVMPAGPRFCKFHIKSPARWLCNKCNRAFCDLCVVSRNVGGVAKRICRTCGVECVPLQVQYVRPAAPRGFFARIPGAFIYPFRGTGLLILICATIAFAVLGFISAGLLSIFAKIVFYGFLFLFMQNIIHSTASDENEPLSFPSAGSLFGAAFQLGGTIAVSFGLAIGFFVARFYDVQIPPAAMIAAVILGCFYFPMAFLAVAMKDSVLAANPLVVIPAMMKIPGQYLVTAILLMSVFGVRQLGSLLSRVAGVVSLTTRDMSVLFIALGVQAAWAFVSVYLLTVNMRILGLLYVAKKDKLGWFSH